MEPAETPPETGVSKSDKTNGMLCHLLALSAFVTGIGIIVGPLIIWLIKKDESEYVDYHGKESLNFQITCVIAYILCIPLFFVLIGIPLLFVVGIGWLVFTIIATIKANEGIRYRYPVAIRLIK